MTLPIASTLEQLTPTYEEKYGFPFENLPDGDAEVRDLRPGLVTALPRRNRPEGSFSELENMRLDLDGIFRRGGEGEYVRVADANKVMHLTHARLEQDRDWIVRVAENSIYAANNTDDWVVIVGSNSWPFEGGSTQPFFTFDKLTSAQLGDILYVAGLEKRLVGIDLKRRIHGEVKDAPRAKFVIAFAERLVVAYAGTPAEGLSPTRVIWSANGQPTIWDPLEDISAGRENLVVGAGDVGEDITGLIPWGRDVAILFRENSIWHITRQPFGSAPFRFTPVVTGFGCDMPYTIKATEFGIIYGDFRSNAVYVYRPGSLPQKLSLNIEDIIFEDIENPSMAEAAYNPTTKEYMLGYPSNPSSKEKLTKWRVLNLRVGGWSVDTPPDATAVGAAPDVGSVVTIGSLTGTIGGLTGSIGDLSGVDKKPSIFLKGFDQGSVYTQFPGVATDTIPGGSSVFFEGKIASQDLGSISRRRTLKMVQWAATALAVNDVVLQVSIDDRSTWTTVKTLTDITSLDKISIKEQFTGDYLHWRILAKARGFTLTEWWAKVLEKSRKRLT